MLRYINTGMPFNLSSLEVSILNPITKSNVEILGKHSSIFLELIHVEQPPQKEKDRKH